MQFEIVKEATSFTWRLVASDGPVAQSPRSWTTEADARSAVAEFRKTARGVRFAKVTVVTK